MARSRTIGIDASRLSVARLTGTETYTLQLLRAMAELERDGPFELYLNASAPPAGLPPLGTPVCIPFPRLWTHGRLSWQMARRPPGVLFVPAHVVPLVHPRTVVTIHDLGYLEYPETHPRSQRRMLDWTTRWSARAARHVIAISESTRRDLIEHYDVPPAKITVIRHGVHEAFRPSTPEEIAATRTRLGLPDRYVLTVGTVQPRKNIARLAAAVARPRESGERIELVVAGQRGWLADLVDRELAEHGVAGSVRFLGYVDERDLPALYSGASVFALVSRYEGFGLPILEAMACGVPVVAANNSAMPEIGGDAALYADARDIDAIATALSRLLNEPELGAAMIGRGFARAAGFTWRAAAGATLAVLRRARDE